MTVFAGARPRTDFAPVPLPLRWFRTHRDAAPTEVRCGECERAMMPLVLGEDGSVAKLIEMFPMIGEYAGDCDEETPAEGAEFWCCMFCRRGTAATWGTRG